MWAKTSANLWFSLLFVGSGEGCDLLLDLRHFAPRTEALDNAWCSCACSGNSWTPTGEQWGTNNGPIKVVDAAGNAGVQKPGKIGVTNPHTAATEKIAEDLSKLVGLPVPAITLDDRGAAAGEPRFVTVSAWAFEAPVTRAQAEPQLSPAQGASLIKAASAMIPFELWIGAADRQNAGNVVIDGALGNPIRGAWIDFAFALDHVWRGNIHPLAGVPPMYPDIGPPDVATMGSGTV